MDFQATVVALAKIKNQKKALEEREAYLLDQLKSLDLEDRDYPAGKYLLRVSPTVRFDAATAQRQLTADQYAATLVTKPDSAKAKKVLSDEDYRLCQKNYGHTIKVVPVTDEEK